MMINIVCFWSYPEDGKEDVFTAEYVNRLQKCVEKNCTQAHQFICYTDRDTADLHAHVHTRGLNSTLKGWWAKLTLFARPELINTPTLYLDLDTIIIDNINDICKYVGKTDGFTILRDFYRSDGYGSGMMAWSGDYRSIWEMFALSPGEIMNRYGGVMGDQWFIETQVNNAKIWQEEFPNKIVSYKIHCQEGKPDGASVVCFHGKPRPHEVEWKI